MAFNKFGYDVWDGLEGILYCDGARVQGDQGVALVGLGTTVSLKIVA